ncbi:MAG: hypothetical protein QXV17_09660 [Candidatus Micrarchaeaceae archaeon]
MALDGIGIVILTLTGNILTIGIAITTLYRKLSNVFENKIREIVRDEINKQLKK